MFSVVRYHFSFIITLEINASTKRVTRFWKNVLLVLALHKICLRYCILVDYKQQKPL